MYRHKKWPVITFKYFIVIRTVMYGQLRYISLLFRQIPLPKPLSHCEQCVPPVATIERCLYVRSLYKHRSCSQQSLKISTSRYGLYDRMTMVRFFVGVAFLFSAPGSSTVASIRPITQRIPRTISRGIRTERDADNCPSHNTLVKNTWRFTCNSHTSPWRGA
jgi:hypothetical protein